MKRQIEADKNQAQIILETIRQEHKKDLKELEARFKVLQAEMTHQNKLDEDTHKTVLGSLTDKD
jgi:flagellar motility protein MotE (MotC chaperone)